ncbi:MAG: glycosyltransferase family 61 protein [Bacteroidota bacterium]
MKFVLRHSYRYVKKNPKLKKLVKPLWGLSPLFLSLPYRLLKRSYSPPSIVFDTAKDWWELSADQKSATTFYKKVQEPESFVRTKPIVLPEDQALLSYLEPKIDLREGFVIGLPNARVWGEGNIITKNNELILEVSGTFLDNKDAYLRHGKNSKYISNSFPKLPVVKKLKGKSVVLAAHAGSGYYHWLIEVLPRLYLLEKAGIDFNSIDHFIVNSLVPGFVRETLEMLGIPLKKVVETHWKPHILAEELIVPSLVGNFFEVPKWTSKFFGSRFKRYIKPRVEGKKVYISRKDAGHRRIVNEDDVTAFLESEGFETYIFETMSMQEKIEILSQASVVLSPHGAGLANIVFCHPGVPVVELTHFSLMASACWNIGDNNDMPYYTLASTPKVPMEEQLRLQTLTLQERAMYHLFIDIDKLEKVLRQVEKAVPTYQNP